MLLRLLAIRNRAENRHFSEPPASTNPGRIGGPPEVNAGPRLSGQKRTFGISIAVTTRVSKLVKIPARRPRRTRRRGSRPGRLRNQDGASSHRAVWPKRVTPRSRRSSASGAAAPVLNLLLMKCLLVLLQPKAVESGRDTLRPLLP